MSRSAITTAILLPLAFAAPSTASAGRTRTIATPVFGCTDRALIDQAESLRTNPRYDYDRLMRAALGAGECRVLPAGMIVVTQRSDLLGGLARVRPVGEPQAVWIGKDALADGEAVLPASAGQRFPPPRP